MADYSVPKQADAPAHDAYDVTPADADLPEAIRGFYVGVTGNVRVTTLRARVANFIAVPAGQIMPVSCARIHATGTTATNIVGLI